ncbi:hypothetical protein GOBAR_DD21453 [Gossypium barbadense]|nr:hypothetical protein GOBAR_DD21453 [Gossypium barbadense]
MELVVETITGYHGLQRFNLIKLIFVAGASYIGCLTQSTTHLMGDPSVEVTDDNRDASHSAKAKAMDAIFEDLGLLNSKELEQLEHQLEPSLKHVRSTKILIKSYVCRQTGQAMASALNVVQTSHSYGDLMLLMKAAELQQERPWSYMVEMARIESIYREVEFLLAVTRYCRD